MWGKLSLYEHDEIQKKLCIQRCDAIKVSEIYRLSITMSPTVELLLTIMQCLRSALASTISLSEGPGVWYGNVR